MSLLKWKEMAAKRSELGQRINEVRKTIKQKVYPIRLVKLKLLNYSNQ